MVLLLQEKFEFTQRYLQSIFDVTPNIMVTTDDPALSDYTFDDVHFYDNRRIYVYLTNDGWDDYYPW